MWLVWEEARSNELAGTWTAGQAWRQAQSRLSLSHCALDDQIKKSSLFPLAWKVLASRRRSVVKVSSRGYGRWTAAGPVLFGLCIGGCVRPFSSVRNSVR